jgi:DNA-binding XRE family transcriptional regulator
MMEAGIGASYGGTGRPRHVGRAGIDAQEHPGLAWREAMESHGFSQARVARQTDVSPKHINMICKGRALPSADLVLKMARVLFPTNARHHAYVMWSLQGRYVLSQAIRDLHDWSPRPDHTQEQP